MIDHVELDLIAIVENEGRAPEHKPQPSCEADLESPANRIVEDVTAHDLQEKGAENNGEQGRRHIVCPRPQPSQSCAHLFRYLLQCVDLVHHARNPGLGEIRFQIRFLYLGAEGIDVRGVDLQTLILEELLQSRL